MLAVLGHVTQVSVCCCPFSMHTLCVTGARVKVTEHVGIRLLELELEVRRVGAGVWSACSLAVKLQHAATVFLQGCSQLNPFNHSSSVSNSRAWQHGVP